MWRLSLCTAALLSIALPETGLTQPHPADRIRILTQSGISLTGEVMEVSADSLRVNARGGPAWVRQADIAYLERSTGRHRRFLRNLAVTVASTASVGGAIAAITWEKCVSNQFLGCLMAPTSRADAFLFGAAVGGTVAIPVGMLVGYVVRYDQWEALPAPRRVSLRVSPSWREPAVSASLSF